MKDLGVWMDESLTFKVHINTTIRKARQALGIVSRLFRDFDDPGCLKVLYCYWVWSILEYACIIWAPTGSKDKERIEKVQNDSLVSHSTRHLGHHQIQQFLTMKHDVSCCNEKSWMCASFRRRQCLSLIFCTIWSNLLICWTVSIFMFRHVVCRYALPCSSWSVALVMDRMTHF